MLVYCTTIAEESEEDKETILSSKQRASDLVLMFVVSSALHAYKKPVFPPHVVAPVSRVRNVHSSVLRS